MGIVSYAQNFEDVMLWRALGEYSLGFWIDVGASDPVVHSVTRAFAEQGWRGINIEPREEEFALLAAARTADINLNVAVSEAAGTMVFYACEDAGLSTLDAAVAARHRDDGREVTERRVETRTLAAICREYAPGEIHFLKIDVEGAERGVLLGADFVRFRPWIVLIEATAPLGREDRSGEWESILLAAKYRFAWFDGLNRFYIAAERWEALAVHFTLPPNVFDGFVMADSGSRLVEIELAKARAEIALLRLAPPARGGLSGLPLRLARGLRGFFSAELRQEIAVLRQDVVRLGIEVVSLRRELRDH